MMASAPSIHAQKRKAFGRGAGWSGVALGMLARLALTEQIIDAASANGRMLRVYAHVFAMMPAAFALGLRCRTDLYAQRSEEHTSELQSLMRISSAVFCLT